MKKKYGNGINGKKYCEGFIRIFHVIFTDCIIVFYPYVSIVNMSILVLHISTAVFSIFIPFFTVQNAVTFSHSILALDIFSLHFKAHKYLPKVNCAFNNFVNNTFSDL